MSNSVNCSTDGPTAGFTIIEALVALAVVTITITAIGSVMASTTWGTRQLEDHVALVQAANNILWRDLPARSDPVSPVLSGQTMEHNWRADIEPLAVDIGAPVGEVHWVPTKVRIQVQSPSGAVVSIETVRLFRKPTK